MAEPFLQDDVNRVLRASDRIAALGLCTRGYLLMSGALHLLAVVGLSLLPASHALRTLPTSDAIRVSLLGPEVAAEVQYAEVFIETQIDGSDGANASPPPPRRVGPRVPLKRKAGPLEPKGPLTSESVPPEPLPKGESRIPPLPEVSSAPAERRDRARPSSMKQYALEGHAPSWPLWAETLPKSAFSLEPSNPSITQDHQEAVEPAGSLPAVPSAFHSLTHAADAAGSSQRIRVSDGQQDSLQRTDFAPLAPPRVSHQVKPQYPLSARQRGIEGTVLLKAHVTEGGRVQDIVVERSTGHPELDRSAMKALGRWRFEPARRGNTAMATWVLVPVTFELD